MRILLASALVLSLFAPVAQAQMSSGNGGAAFNGMDRANDPTREMMVRFIDASRMTLAGNQQLLSALGQSQEAAAMGERAGQLSEAMSRRAVEETLEAQLRGMTSASKALAAGGQVPAAQLEQGLASLAQAVAQYEQLLKDLPEAKAAMNTVRKISKVDTPTFFMLRSLSGSTASLKQEIRAVAQACQQAGVKVPEALLAM
ncbi:hypothetical protein SAMN05518865_107150 [Duganella sp. CF458]|uniref:hypothetical protein n=1 Tax=Duganella sp. CF458 TaxID=1884368 RepID=UPI0008E50552|nr:hypothetical protein [Duganella sp. CF458]SFG02229.1 hypothetical protein SAMN05518865_107150 [Duganella sp. CF458]